MKKYLVGMLAAILWSNTSYAQQFYVGGALSFNHIDSPFTSGSADATGFGLQGAVKIDRLIPDVDTWIELGVYKTDHFFDSSRSKINGIYAATVVEKYLPEINPNVAISGKLGLDVGDDDGLIMGVGASLKTTETIFLKGELINQDSLMRIQGSLNILF